MSEPVVFDKKPAVLELEAGNHAWCACGLSKNQPFCDGSHKPTEHRPIVFKLEQKKRVALCNCKHSGNKPYCDGTHSKL